MNAYDYKTVIRLLRDICKDAINLASNFQLSESDISSILRKEELIEEILTVNFCNVEPLTDKTLNPFGDDYDNKD